VGRGKNVERSEEQKIRFGEREGKKTTGGVQASGESTRAHFPKPEKNSSVGTRLGIQISVRGRERV